MNFESGLLGDFFDKSVLCKTFANSGEKERFVLLTKNRLIEYREDHVERLKYERILEGLKNPLIMHTPLQASLDKDN
jgi:hypothetical protein